MRVRVQFIRYEPGRDLSFCIHELATNILVEDCLSVGKPADRLIYPVDLVVLRVVRIATGKKPEDEERGAGKTLCDLGNDNLDAFNYFLWQISGRFSQPVLFVPIRSVINSGEYPSPIPF